MVRIVHALMIFSFAGIIAGCGSSAPSTVATAEERFARAKELFDKQDYLAAINEFTVLTLQYQGSTVASDAQYYLAECRYNRGEYLLAAYEYSVLKRIYPASARVPEAQYKLALSYFSMSPKAALDQQYTKKAIDELQTFVEYYPANPLAADADLKIKELNTRLAKKAYESGLLYAKMEYYKAALLAYDSVIEKYHDTEYAPLASLGKVEILMSRNRYKDAEAEVQKFIDRYPNSVLRGRADEMKKTIDNEIQRFKKTGASVAPGQARYAQLSDPSAEGKA
jgi:outer membrane protein assembly factor BamD